MSAGSTTFPTTLDSNTVRTNADEITSTDHNDHSIQIEATEKYVFLNWATSTVYVAGQTVRRGYSLFVCITGHTSGTFATNWLTNGYWAALGEQPGDVKMWSAATAPAGWLLCNNAAVSRTTYADLFAVTGTTYGVGDNSTTFNLPDTRGIFVRGAGTSAKLTNALAAAFAATLGTYQNDAFQAHFHNIEAQTLQYSLPGGTVFASGTTYGRNLADNVTAPTTDGSHGTPRTDTESRPANLALSYIIKY